MIITQSLSSHGLICISHSISSLCTSTFGVRHPFHHLTMWWMYWRGSFASATVWLSFVAMEDHLWWGMTIIHSVFASTLNGGGRGAHLHPSQCHSLYLGWRWGRGSFAFTTVCLLLPWMEVGEGLICIYHSVSPSTLNGGGGGAHLHLPQCVCLYLEWRWGRGSFAFTTVCLLPRMEVGEGLICIYHGMSPSTLSGDGGVAHLHLPQCVSLYLEWRWGRGSAFTTVCLLLPWM